LCPKNGVHLTGCHPVGAGRKLDARRAQTGGLGLSGMKKRLSLTTGKGKTRAQTGTNRMQRGSAFGVLKSLVKRSFSRDSRNALGESEDHCSIQLSYGRSASLPSEIHAYSLRFPSLFHDISTAADLTTAAQRLNQHVKVLPDLSGRDNSQSLCGDGGRATG
jgi:hypothetical protein